MAARTIDNGKEGSFQLEIKAGDDGDIQVVALEPEKPITVATAGDRRFSVPNTGVTSFPNIPSNANRAQISVETAALRWLDDPGASVHPSPTHGHLLVPPAGDAVYYWINGADRIANFEMYGTTGTPAVVQVSFYE